MERVKEDMVCNFPQFKVGSLGGLNASLERVGIVGYAVKQHGETIGHDIHPNYASISEKGAKSKDKRLFLESVHSFLDKNTLNERAPFQRVDASFIISFLPKGR